MVASGVLKPHSSESISPVLGKRQYRKINDPLKKYKIAIWLYFILLIFEGALRKWVLPGLSTPLLIVRDPIAIWLVVSTGRRGLLSINIYTAGMMLIGFIGIFTAMFLGHGNFLVAIYGARVLMVHFPIIFIMGNVFTRDDIIKVGKFLVWLTIPMTILLIFQFYSPQSAWVNRGIGGDTAGGGFTGALGFYRGPTTFSFSNGTSLFYNLVSCFIFYFWLTPQKYVNKTILIIATLALFISIPLSISRTLFFSIVITAAFALFAVSKTTKFFKKIIIITLSTIGIFIILSQLSIFQTATEVFTARFTNASASEGGLQGTIGGRFFGGMVDAIASADRIPFFGFGIGMGTNVGSQLLTGEINFLVAEDEWGRLIGELGIVLGLAVIAIRLSVCLKITKACYKWLKKGEILPWILLSNCLLTIPQAQWAQPTALGFSVVIGGLTVASMRLSKSDPKIANNTNKKLYKAGQ